MMAQECYHLPRPVMVQQLIYIYICQLYILFDFHPLTVQWGGEGREILKNQFLNKNIHLASNPDVWHNGQSGVLKG